jgi:hypothetical protein
VFADRTVTEKNKVNHRKVSRTHAEFVANKIFDDGMISISSLLRDGISTP